MFALALSFLPLIPFSLFSHTVFPLTPVALITSPPFLLLLVFSLEGRRRRRRLLLLLLLLFPAPLRCRSCIGFRFSLRRTGGFFLFVAELLPVDLVERVLPKRLARVRVEVVRRAVLGVGLLPAVGQGRGQRLRGQCKWMVRWCRIEK